MVVAEVAVVAELVVAVVVVVVEVVLVVVVDEVVVMQIAKELMTVNETQYIDDDINSLGIETWVEKISEEIKRRILTRYKQLYKALVVQPDYFGAASSSVYMTMMCCSVRLSD